MSSLFPYQTFADDLDTFTDAELIEQMGLTERTLYGPPPFTWATKAFFARGKIAHGTSLPSGYESGLTMVDGDGVPLGRNIYWDALAPWVVAIAESDNLCTNAYIKISKIRCYILSKRTGLWKRFGPLGNGYPSIAPGKWKYDFSAAYGPSTAIYDVDGAPAYWPWHTVGPEQVMLHNAIISKGYIDGADFDGVFVTCQSQLVAPAGEAFDATPHYSLQIGADLYPDTTTSTNSGILTGRTYIAAIGGNAMRTIPSDGTPRMHYFITSPSVGVTAKDGTSIYEVANGATSMYMSNAELAANMPSLTPNLSIVQTAALPATVAIDISLAGGTTQPQSGTAVLSIDFTTGTPTEVTITRNDNHAYALWPTGALSGDFTVVSGGLEFSLDLAAMDLGLNVVSVRATYADYQSTTDRLILTIEEAVPAYDAATLYAPLKTSLVLDEGTGSPTLTRATAMWVFDNEDKMITVPASAAALGGARMVRNMLSSPDVLATQGVTTEAKTYTISFYGTGSVAFSGTYAGASLAGTGVGDRVQRTFTTTAGTLTLTVTGSVTTAQLENVTGQTNQTASEYVSVGVESAPYHGAGADGVKWFNTNKDGTVIPDADLLGIATIPTAITNSMLWCRNLTPSDWNFPWLTSNSGSAVFSDTCDATTQFSATAATLSIVSGVLRSTATGSSTVYTKISFTTVAGKTYKLTYDSVAKVGSGLLQVWFGTSAQGNQLKGRNSGISTGTYQIMFTATSTTTHASFLMSGTVAASDYFDIDNISVYEAGVQPLLTGTGLDKAANSCSLLTATANDATILQTITAAAAAGCTGFYVKRSTGTGTIEITRDGGSTWTDVTSLINGSTFTLVGIENTSVTNPVIGFRIGTSGDAIIVDGGINHLGTKLHYLPILTTTAAVTVNAQTLTYPTTSNISDTAGTILATVQQDTWTAGGVVGSATHGLFANTATSGVQAKDGTNTASGEIGTPTGSVKLGCRWSGSSLEAFSATTYLSVGDAASYDGSFNLSTISVGSGVAGYVKDVAIYV